MATENKKNTCGSSENISFEEAFLKQLKQYEDNSSNIDDNYFNNITTEDTLGKIEQYNLIVLQKSEEAYIEIVRDVVKKSGENLSLLRKDKTYLRNRFVCLFSWILVLQIIVLFGIFACKGFVPSFAVSNDIIMTYMTTVFLETLGVIALMITFAFKSAEEIKIIGILNSVVSNYQKYKDNKNK